MLKHIIKTLKKLFLSMINCSSFVSEVQNTDQ